MHKGFARQAEIVATGVGALCALLLGAAPLQADEPGGIPGLPAEPSSAQGVLALADARREARAHSPELEASLWDERAQAARVDQAGRLPNPELIVDVENIGGAGLFYGIDLAETTVSLQQPIELGGKRDRRRAVAERRMALAARERALLEREVDARATRAFVTALSAQQRLALAEELVARAEALAADTRRASEVDRSRASLAVSRSHVVRARAEARHAAARVQLAAALGAEALRAERLRGELSRLAEPPSLESLLAAAERAPRLERSQDEVAMQRASLRLEQARRLPDVDLKAGYRRLSGLEENVAVFGVTVPLPLFDRNAGEVDAARSELESAQRQRFNAELELRRDLALAYEQAVSAYHEARALADEVVPAADEALDHAMRAYARRELGLPELVHAQRNLFDARADHLDALERYHHAIVDVGRLVDVDLAPNL